MRNVLPIFFLHVFLAGSFAQKPTVQADRTTIRIGEPVTVSFSLEVARQIGVVWPLFSDSIGSMEITHPSSVDSVMQDETKHYHQALIVTSFDSGMNWISPVLFRVGGDSVFTDSIMIAVETVPVDTAADIRPIKSILGVRYGWRERIPWIIGALLLIMASFVVFYVVRRRKPEKIHIAAPEVLRPAHEVALEKLAILDEKKLWQSGNEKAYHLAVSEILREYLDRRFRFSAVEATTEEILNRMRKEQISYHLFEELKWILESGDLVKFAKLSLLPDEHQRCLSLSVHFVEQTKEVVLSDEHNKKEA
jgi:hypothetical protein